MIDRIFVLCVTGVLVGVLHTASGQVGSCIGIDSCSCKYEDGTILSLAPLSRDDGTPAFANVSDQHGSFVSWNPCKPFSYEGTECENVSVCVIRGGIPETLYYDISTEDSAVFTYNEKGSLQLQYSSDHWGFKRAAVITLQCLASSPFEYFVNNGEQEPGIFHMTLASKYACGLAPAISTPATAEPSADPPVEPSQEPYPFWTSMQPEVCIQTSTCSCTFPDGTVINLEELSRSDGLPAFVNVSDGNGGYVSWNPCKPFSFEGTECENVSVCAVRDGIPYTHYYNLGTDDSARFTYNKNGSLQLHYTSDQGDFKRSAIIILKCLASSTFDFFVNEGEQEPDNDTVVFQMILASRYACGLGPSLYTAATEEPPVYPTVEPTLEPYPIWTSMQPEVCIQTSTCSCTFPDGTVINLEELTRGDGDPRFANISDGFGNYVSWNPCQSFDYYATECTDVAVCVIRDGIPEKLFYNLGTEYSARFGRDDNGNMTITYRSTEGLYTRVASIRLECSYGAYTPSFRLEGEEMPNQYTIVFNMVLVSRQACTFTPQYTTFPPYTTEPPRGCYQGSSPCRCQFPNGTAINLEPVSKFDNTPFFYNVASKEGDRVSWNPCEKFTFEGTACQNVYMCIAVEKEDSITFHGIFDPVFSSDYNEVQSIDYIGYSSGESIKVIVAFECLEGSGENFLMAERAQYNPYPFDLKYNMVLASKYACPEYP